jgi:transposase
LAAKRAALGRATVTTTRPLRRSDAYRSDPRREKGDASRDRQPNRRRGSIVSTDELISYGLLSGDGDTHAAVDHSRKERVWTDRVSGTRHHVNGFESFWHLFKASVASTHIRISEKYMDRYLGDFQFRSNHREMRNAMFDLLIAAL